MSDHGPSGRAALMLGLLSTAAWLGSFAAWVGGSFFGVLLLMLAGIALAPAAATVSSMAILRAGRTGEPMWPAVIGLAVSLPPAAFIAYAVVWGLIYD